MDADPAELRKLPKIDRLLEHPRIAPWRATVGAEAVLAGTRAAVEAARLRVLAGGACPDLESVAAEAEALLRAASTPTLRPVINATGVVIHTNLGRAPLAAEALEAMTAVARGYCSLEYDLARGERGARDVHGGRLAAQLAGAEDGLVVNNNAGAVTLVLAALCRDREAILSRGQLVEIGGGFRIPDVMRQSGAALVEVGTTNRTYTRDYEEAIGLRTAALMVVHRSNFSLSGFVHDASLEELAALARARGLVMLDDLGSGTFLDTAPFGLAHEPQVQERIAAGADLVCFSGDKLVGGPQAGFIVGRRELIARLKAFPLLRALRVDKVTLAGIEATLRLYQRGQAATHIPIWRAIGMPLEALRERALAWRQRVAPDDPAVEVVDASSAIGGGSLPGLVLPTAALAVTAASADRLAERLRSGETPVVGRVERGRVLLDPRTVMPHEDDLLCREVMAARAADRES